MRAIVVGGGNLGFVIAELLTKENYDVTVIEIDDDTADSLEEKLDVSVIRGNGASYAVLESAGVSEAKILLAVTASDELNMVACMLGKQAGAESTVARVSNPEYLERRITGSRALSGIDLMINPELVAAREIANLIEVPEALDVMYYADHQAMMLELPVSAHSPVKGIRLRQLNPESPHLIIAIAKNGKVVIPRGNDRIEEGDIFYLLAKTSEMTRIESLFGVQREEADKVMILGGGRTGEHLGRLLEGKDYAVRIIEKDMAKCEALSEELRHTLVIHGDATDLDLLRQEGAGKADMFISVTDDDKVNLLVSVIVKHLGAKRTIALVRRPDYIDIMEEVGIDIGVSQRAMTAGVISRFIKRSANLLTFTQLRDEEVNMLEFVVRPDSKITGRKLMDIHFPSDAIVGSIWRNGELSIAKGNDRLAPEDKVTVFCLPRATDQVISLLR